MYLQEITESSVRLELLKQVEAQRLSEIKDISSHISSDLDTVIARLYGLEDSKEFQNGNFDAMSEKLVSQKYLEINGIVDRIFVTDAKNIVRINEVPPGEKKFLGYDVTNRTYVQKAISSADLYLSDYSIGLDGKSRLYISNKITDHESGKFLGITWATVPVTSFFSRYYNIDDSNSPFMMVMDKNGTYLISPFSNIIGKNFFSNDVQSFFNNNSEVTKYTKELLAGKSGITSFDFGLGPRTVVYSPVFVQGIPQYYLIIITPHDSIFGQIDAVLSLQRNEIVSGFTVGMISISVLIILLLRRDKKLFQNEMIIQKQHDELVKNEKLSAIGHLASRLAHDIRNPLSIIMNAAMLIKQKNPNLDEKTLNFLDKQIDATKRISAQLDDVLDFVRTTPPNMEYHSVLGIIKSAVDKIVVPETIEIVLPTSDFKIYCDENKIEVVLVNLITNAIHAIKEKGKIMVRVFEAENNQVIEVEDNGEGIPRTILPKIFEPLFTTKSFGTGLGLASCKNIIESHKGTITVQSSEGVKTIFRIKLPKNSKQIPDI
ncbi:MAG: sensor histidine kinase [Candidatus Nitrosotalea sp.]|nr:sensor histidine kinase [Candidatus Nitrosotalea sp.]